MKTKKILPYSVALAMSITASSLVAEPTELTKKAQLLANIEAELEVTNIYNAYFPDVHTARQAAKSFHNNIMETHYNKGYLVLELTEEEKEKLKPFGFTFTTASEFIKKRDAILTEIRTLARTASDDVSIASIPGYSCYETVEETYDEAEAIVRNNPSLAEWIDVGDSWEKTTNRGGYDIYVLKLTNQNIGGDKPKLFINSAIHAREYTTAPLNLAFANWLVDGYGTNADATWILDHHEVHLMLQANPDARKQAETGISWRKNANQNYCGSTSNRRGADLNRNFSFTWNITNGQGSSGSQCNDTYRGPSPGSEPETQAIERYARSLWPDSRGPNQNDAAPRTTSGIHIDIHSYSELVLWPWGSTRSQAPNGSDLQSLGRKFAFFNGYSPEQSIGLYATDGTSDAVSYGELGVAAYTFELGTAFFQRCSTYTNTILPDNLEALIYAAKVVRTPYITSSGPDITSLRLDADIVQAGTSVDLSIRTSDARFNNSNGREPTQDISAVEYYIDIPPWQSGAVANPLTSDDGSFNEVTEDASAVINTSGLSEGQHMIYVRAQDETGTWGTVSAEFLTISGDTPPPPPPPPPTDCIELEDVSPYSNTNTGSYVSDGCTIELSGNIWRATNETFTISEDTVLTFDFSANGTGEIHGIGLSQSNTASSNRTFNLIGSQNYGIDDFRYGGSGTETISIPVGEYFTGSGYRLILINDKDSGTENNETTISNVFLTD
ncbi:M14 family metallopeptidase [Marinibactrum halimedae]|uniref:carboxypeptidase T n=1 Tax=Marinibactrum halimedae TaxID=1444977 RepID=A0AA37T5N5_9GAMM|nr:M14 family metallopeptidase [Marinibactrum halimedae]MCD9461088.1 M14 family metallopeptidase [Marinibactrum halimedae]GLS25738.1 hypothetical protein GCM10007877_14520 [Marinibactrum halimedae]